MKFRLEVDPGAEEELVLRVRELNAQALRLQKWASDLLVEKAEMKLYRGDTEYYVPFETILFFESGEHRTAVHTAMQIYTTELRLYELEQLLPHTFVRCAKACILNVSAISAVTRSLSGGAEISFCNSEKKAFASRMYYKAMMERSDAVRF